MEKIEGVNIRRRTVIIKQRKQGMENGKGVGIFLEGNSNPWGRLRKWKEKGDNNWRRKIFGQQRIRRPEKEKEQTI